MEIFKAVLLHLFISFGLTLFGGLISSVVGPVGIDGGLANYRTFVKPFDN